MARPRIYPFHALEVDGAFVVAPPVNVASLRVQCHKQGKALDRVFTVSVLGDGSVMVKRVEGTREALPMEPAHGVVTLLTPAEAARVSGARKRSHAERMKEARAQLAALPIE